MARPGVAYATTEAHIEAYVAEHGKPPSIARIIDDLGGSATTIARHKRQWLEGQTVENPRTVPDPLLQGLHQGAVTVWNELIEALDAKERELTQRFTAKNQEADHAVSQAQDQATRAREAYTSLDATLKTTEQALHQTSDSRDALFIELGDVNRQLAAVTARCEGHEQQLTERGERLTALQLALEKSERQLEASIATRRSAEGEHRDAIEALRKEHKDEMRILRDAASQRADEWADRISALERTLAANTEQKQRTEVALDETRAKLTKRDAALAEQAGKLATLRAELAGDRTEFAAALKAEQTAHATTRRTADVLIQEKDARLSTLSNTVDSLHKALAGFEKD